MFVFVFIRDGCVFIEDRYQFRADVNAVDCCNNLGEAILVVLLASVVTSLTTLSMSAVSTNGQIKGGNLQIRLPFRVGHLFFPPHNQLRLIESGGTYYMISRSLGPEFGGAIGIIFALANAVAVSLHTVGFCEALNDLLKSLGVRIVDNGPNDVRIIGSCVLLLLASIVLIGMEWEAKAQLVLMAILLVSLANFIVGNIMGPSTDEERAKGFIGFNCTPLFPTIRSQIEIAARILLAVLILGVLT